jgi:pilus assembly protein CpaC
MERQVKQAGSGRLLAVLLMLAPTWAAAQQAQPIRTIEVPLHSSTVVDLDVAPRRVSVGSQEVADILLLRARQIYVLGKSLGSTNVLLWDAQDRLIETVNVQVSYDVETLKRKLHELLPEEPIRVNASQGAVVLSGEASSAPKMEMAMELARSLVTRGDGEAKTKGRVLNMMQVGGAQQVLLEVKVAEIARNFIKRLGAKFNVITTDGNLSLGAINGPGHIITQPFPGEGAAIPPGTGSLLPGEFLTDQFILDAPTVPGGQPTVRTLGDIPVNGTALLGSFLDGTTLFNVAIDAAKEEGLAKVLAEPTLTTLTGHEAAFIAGGEFPVPVPGGDNQGTLIVFKDFGVGLKFVPTVLDSGVISLKVDISVSELSTDNSVVLDVPGVATNFFVPSLTKRGASSTVELAHGQTIGIAGLINENLRERVSKFPGLGDIPLLGALFRSQEFVKGQTELVIFVTPRFAKPIGRDDIVLPTDRFVEPGDAEFYLLGRLHGSAPEKRLNTPQQGGLEGRIGHAM